MRKSVFSVFFKYIIGFFRKQKILSIFGKPKKFYFKNVKNENNSFCKFSIKNLFSNNIWIAVFKTKM